MSKLFCPSCKRAVELVYYGGGWIGICPQCQRLVYNDKNKPEGYEEPDLDENLKQTSQNSIA